MMTVMMDNISAPSARERVQHLFNKNIELENGLRKAAQSKIPSDPNAWSQMRENYEAIILEDHHFSELHEIEYALWQLHYRRIEEFRAHINSTPASTGGKGAARPDRIKKILSVFRAFLSEATGFYHDLIQKIRAKYGLPLGYFSDGPENEITLSKDGKKSAEMRKGLVSCHRCLIYLGDLARYKGLYGEGDSVARDYAAASSYYIQSASLWPSSGNPHHQLAIMASYSGNDLIVVYRYFRSLAVDSPFSTARDNLIIAFEKNHQSYTQLSMDAKIAPVKTPPVRKTGRERGRGETRLLAKDVKAEGTPIKERVSTVPETYKAFCIRFVRLNGILFTRTSLETFGEIFSLVISDLQDLLSSGPEEELNFGSDAAENGLFTVRLITILIFMVHNVNRESEGQSYAEILQHSVLLQNAFTSAFEFVGHILKRCLQLRDVLSSSLLPTILVFTEWLACRPDIAAGSDIKGKQATARSFFWNQCVSFLNKLISTGFVSIEGDEDETCFSDMSRYDEGETGNRLALWEDFELRGFSPLLPAQLILDFSRKPSFGDGSNKEKRARVQRILATGKVLMNVVRVDQQVIYFDQKLKRYSVGVERQTSEDDLPIITASVDISQSNGVIQGMPVEKPRNLGVLQLNARLFSAEEEEEDEVIVFKPTIVEKHADLSAPKSLSHDLLEPVENYSKGNWESFTPALSTPLNTTQLQAATVNTSSRALASFANGISEPLQHINPSTSKWVSEHQAILLDGLKNLSITGNGFVDNAGLKAGLGVSQAPAFSLPFSLNTNPITGTLLSSQMGVSEAVIPSKLDSIMPAGANADGPTMKPAGVPTNSRRNPVSRPVRHFGPPPGFSPIPPKQLNDSVPGLALNNDHAPVDDYSWLDGYQFTSNKGTELNNSLNHMGPIYPNLTGNGNSSANGIVSFPFPGKQVPTVQAQVETPNSWPNYQLLEHLKLYKEQQQQLQRGNQQSAPLPEHNQAQSLWSGRFIV
ncbi:nonsense-mediated mRNA decay factor SMG7-like [Tasmannia lanceolata]|uniref:nonsense-mediated mRNA decay factor SMG7-like n=1 Tax=Tasmannia lanceolata TaxID=3420 RepID=UPI004064876E